MLDIPTALMDLPSSPTLDPAVFRRAMRLQACGVAVVTVAGDEARTGFTATSVTSLSVEPPRILVCVNRASSSYPLLAREGRFAVNFLGAEQQSVAERFAGAGGATGAARFEGATWRRLRPGTLVIDEALVSLDCVVEELVERHSHCIVIAEVLGASETREADALLYWQGQYRALPPAGRR
jgi:flavin reductase (DIM6/NTAB) family NADH-FMN oxidoreductase RutF